MITTLTLNPCIDRTITIENFLYGGTNKVTGVRQEIGGKGINVSIVLKNLGADTACLGFACTGNGDPVGTYLEKQQIPCDLVDVEGDLRVNVKIFDTSSRVMSEFNESGHPVTEKDVERLLEKTEEYLERTDILVLAGSVPKGVPSSIYRTIIEKANKKGIRTVLDAANELFLEGIKGKPYLIKPNIDELSQALGREIGTKEEIIRAAREIIDAGVTYVCVSMGKEGAVIVSREEAYFAPALDVEVRGIQGAGDSLVAGMCIAMEEGREMKDLIRYGAAAAGGSLMREGTQLCRKEEFDGLLAQAAAEKQ